jgi:hypothetical protein
MMQAVIGRKAARMATCFVAGREERESGKGRLVWMDRGVHHSMVWACPDRAETRVPGSAQAAVTGSRWDSEAQCIAALSGLAWTTEIVVHRYVNEPARNLIPSRSERQITGVTQRPLLLPLIHRSIPMDHGLTGNDTERAPRHRTLIDAIYCAAAR